jgi:hypothetical protein
MSIGLNAYLFFGVITTKQKEKSEEESSWINGFGSEMWDLISAKLFPSKAVYNLYGDQQFNVTVRNLYWAPFDSGPRDFYFKIYDQSIDFFTVSTESPILVGERNITVYKSNDEMDYDILFNCTVTLRPGIHLYRIVGASWPTIDFTHYDCAIAFAITVD